MAHTEDKRKAAIDLYKILDTPREESFDRIARLAARIIGAPIALISLADTNRMWFKSSYGMDVQEITRDLAFCPYALDLPETLVIENAASDARFATNPLVTGDAHIRFYAGSQLRNSEGVCLGTLCVLGHEPRKPSPEDIAALEDLRQGVVAELELRRLTARLESELVETKRLSDELRDSREKLKDFLDATSDLLWEADAALHINIIGGRDSGLATTLSTTLLSDITNHFFLSAGSARFAADVKAHRPFRHVEIGRPEGDQEIWLDISGKPVFNDGEFCGYRGSVRDISDRKRIEKHIRRLGEEDPLTGLPNRRAFDQRLRKVLSSTGEAESALLLLDIDRFKQVNDSLGHDAGDVLVKAMAGRITRCLRNTDMVARIGGDEFAVIIENATDSEMENMATRIDRAAKEPFSAFEHTITSSLSGGGVRLAGGDCNSATALKRADIALYRSKHAGRAQFTWFEDESSPLPQESAA